MKEQYMLYTHVYVCPEIYTHTRVVSLAQDDFLIFFLAEYT